MGQRTLSFAAESHRLQKESSCEDGAQFPRLRDGSERRPYLVVVRKPGFRSLVHRISQENDVREVRIQVREARRCAQWLRSEVAEVEV